MNICIISISVYNYIYVCMYIIVIYVYDRNQIRRDRYERSIQHSRLLRVQPNFWKKFDFTVFSLTLNTKL